ncbi:MAG: CO dehydrogenase/acetyl-CoA synthase subunit delta [Euryarchaeota archaeon]|nr:CO dehydrogenase/acetyl-CoA synthase subunit delta [Euryarchaeota archaeon]
MKKLDLEEILRSLVDVEDLELENVEIDAEELIVKVKQAMLPLVLPQAQVPGAAEKEALPEVVFEKPVGEYRGYIEEVTLGATRSEGGTRGKVIKIGGQRTLYHFEGGWVNRPVVSFDVFDIPQPQFPKALREAWGEVWDSPAEWAREAVRRGADLVTIHLVSTDPKVKDTPVGEAAKTVEEVLQAVDVPLVVGGSGNPEKDPVLFEKVAEVAENERCLLASANLDLDHERIVKAAVKHNHNVLSWVSLDINDQKMLNRLLLEEGLPRDRMVQDPTTAALGYGLEYTYTMIERIKLNALKGEKELAFPVSCGVTNAWAAREAWMNVAEWGPREYRGPLWETINALAVMLSGADIMMMLHPSAVQAIRSIIDSIFGDYQGVEIRYEDWLKV